MSSSALAAVRSVVGAASLAYKSRDITERLARASARSRASVGWLGWSSFDGTENFTEKLAHCSDGREDAANALLSARSEAPPRVVLVPGLFSALIGRRCLT